MNHLEYEKISNKGFWRYRAGDYRLVSVVLGSVMLFYAYTTSRARRLLKNESAYISRNTQGVTLIKIAKGEKLVSVAKIAETEDDETPEDETEAEQ